ncbi:MAG TPA: hypothetical protein PLS03_05780 [Terrimicrobiaceae bacterium]|nr:hypothetical protein [Terrimicrobiaceae bacterium]
MRSLIFLFPALLLSAHPGQAGGFDCDFEDDAVVRQEWSAEGSSKDIPVISAEKAASGKHSLALVDRDSAGHGAWVSQPITIPPDALAKEAVTVSWQWLYAIAPTQSMRLTVIFVGDGAEKNARHFPVKGESEGWGSGTFTAQRHELPIPPGVSQLRIKLSSAVSSGAEGEFYLDDLHIGP